MSLTVLVVSASKLQNVEGFGKSDPFCVIDLEEEKKETKVIKNDLDPQWNDRLTWTLQAPLSGSESLKLEVFDYEKLRSNKLLGILTLSLKEVVYRKIQSIIDAALMSKNGEVMQSTISLKLTYNEPEGGDGSEERGKRKGGEKDNDKGGLVESREEAHRRVSAHAKLPNKPLDWQVRVHLLEGRKLLGANLDPIVKVVCGNIIKETSSRKDTNNPLFDEMLFFTFNERPQEMFDRVVEIKVLHANIKIIRDTLIGSFKFDLGMVYDEQEQCLIHKWLLLTHPNDPSSTAKGYLKISINVIGPGDHPKPSPFLLSPESVDIESNLLRPSGVRLQSGTLTIKIYRGEDMPQMDPGYFEGFKRILNIDAVQKDQVDPYCSVSFAGKEGQTPVIWNDYNPEWDHQINLSIRLPSMCERLMIRLKDKDKMGNDDVIGTAFLSMSQISANEDEEFLTTFGPCFVNVYGSPREFTHFSDKYNHFNMGIIDGVAYRGRVMVEVHMTLGELPANKQEPIKEVDKNSVRPFLCRHNYRLFGVFFSATMIHPTNTIIEFEVSIGNYGNKLETSIPPQSSTTPPSNSLFDGNHYHYLPWLDEKPCVVVNSQWEDCTYRITSMNILHSIADKLETGLKMAKKDMYMKIDDIDTIKCHLGEVLDDFISDLSQDLPPLADKQVTKLDRLRREIRVKKLEELKEAAIQLRINSPELEDMVNKCEVYISFIRNLVVEPQQSVPDVVVWMLAGRKRVVCTRIPAHKLFFTQEKGRGQLCGKIQTLLLTPPAVEEEDDQHELKDRAQVRIMLWLEIEREEESHFVTEIKGNFSVYAETYENEVLLGRWGTTGLLRPHWSDCHGEINQPKDSFQPPPGWSWDGSWLPSPDYSARFNTDYSHNEWTEEIYENQALPFNSKSYWTNATGVVEQDLKSKKEITKDEVKCPEGWRWVGDWQVDKARSVDYKGWEYTVKAGSSSWVPYQRNEHHFRRRKWVRLRVVDEETRRAQMQREAALLKEGWEYAQFSNRTYHLKRHPLDLARRRRYLCKLKGNPCHPAIFYFKTGDGKVKQQVPRIFVTFKNIPHTYQLRAYIYQARDMYSSDRSGLADPYCLVSFHTSSNQTRVVSEQLCPFWDQTLLIKNIKIFEDTSQVVECPPPVVIEFMDKDKLGRDEFLGRTEVYPVVRLSLDVPEPRLDWFPIARYNKYAGELLAAFELLLDEGNDLPPALDTADPPFTHCTVPSGIRPSLQKSRIEVLCWGVRDMKRFHLLHVTSPLVEIECGGVTVKSKPIKNTEKNPNFPQPVLILNDVPLPKEELYTPPLNIRVMKQSFGRCKLVGVHVIKTLERFKTDQPQLLQGDQLAAAMAQKVATLNASMEMTLVVEEKTLESDPDIRKKVEFDWWSKYYCSIDDPQRTQREYVDQGYDMMKIYPNDLEESFDKFEDLAQKFPLYRGKGSREGECVGYFKGSLRVYPLPEGFEEPPLVFPTDISTKPVECVVRVYIIRAETLMPKDSDGKSDPYIKVKVGKGGKGKEINDKENYIPSNLNPIFGKMFELNAHLPFDNTLTVTVMDWDRVSADDLIGETVIDLENRFLSHYRATCGLPNTFCKRGVNRWRDRELPVQVLEDWCKMMNLNPPEWSSDKRKVIIDREYSLDQYEHNRTLPEEDLGDEEQRLALHVIKEKCNFVPEHVEKRTLRNFMTQNISMGTLHMWVDIFPKEGALPPPVDISPRKPEKFVLRVVVYNTMDVLLDEVSIATGDNMSDIYVKGWIRGQDDTQKTDVHYRSMDGEGNFNWRMVFPFGYLPAEQVMVIKKKEHFYSLTTTDVHMPPRLTLQVWDNDFFSPDDYIGTIDFNLTGIPEPVQNVATCSIDQLPTEEVVDMKVGMDVSATTASSNVTLIDLFHKKRVKGWWPVFSYEEGERDLTGKLELEIEVLTEEEALLKPASKARDEPNQNPHLEEPIRPATSFLWFTSPLKTFKHIIWRHYKWHIVGGAVVILLVLLLVILIYTTPSTFLNWVVSRLLPV